MGAFDVKLDSVKLDVNQLLGQIGGIGREVRTLITGKEIEDPNKRAEIDARLQEMEELGREGQRKINEIEAGHTSIFVAGWRPLIGWVCGASMACYYIPISLFSALVWTIACIKAGWVVQPYIIPFNLTELIGLMGSLLGLGTLRTLEKVKNVEGNR
jgi:Holin of 3TMs, for gene-transfer release